MFSTVGQSWEDNLLAHEKWCNDLAVKFLCIFVLDRFGDFVSDQVRTKLLYMPRVTESLSWCRLLRPYARCVRRRLRPSSSTCRGDPYCMSTLSSYR